MDKPGIVQLAWKDADLGAVDLPGGRMAIGSGFGSGLAIRPGDPPGIVWAVCDRGPNLKIKTMVERFGVDSLQRLAGSSGAKIMPRLDLGPALARLRVGTTDIELIEEIRLATPDGRPLPGLPLPGGEHATREPALSLEGEDLGSDPAGADTEGVAALGGGGFWLADEYGPSLLRVDGEGRLLLRWVPEGDEAALEGCGYDVAGVIPAIAGRRQLNRGFEALALSPDERWLWVAFQSPLAHPDEDAHRSARHVRLWKLHSRSGQVEAQFLYPLDPPVSFGRDSVGERVDWSDLKVSEITIAGEGALLVLERASKTTKIYKVAPSADRELGREHLDIATRPTVEEMSGAGTLSLPVLHKTLLFSTDDAPDVAPDLEGMAMLSPTELLLVSDNDFGVEGAETCFYRLTLLRPAW
jgi:hypothetical protein